MISCGSHDSECSNGSGDSHTKLMMRTSSARNSPLSKKKSINSLSLSSSRQKPVGSLPGSTHSSPSNQPKFSFRGPYAKFRSSSTRSSTESIHKLSSQRSVSQNSLSSHSSEMPQEEPKRLKWSEGDVFAVDMITRKVTLHQHTNQSKSLTHSSETDPSGQKEMTDAAKSSEVTSQSVDTGDANLKTAPAKPEGKESAPSQMEAEEKRRSENEGEESRKRGGSVTPPLPAQAPRAPSKSRDGTPSPQPAVALRRQRKRSG